MTASETLTKEKLWAKSIPITQQQVNVASEKVYATQDGLHEPLLGDPGVINPLINTMEGLYTTIFNTAWNNLDPQELKPLKHEVEEIREKKKY